MRAGNRLVVGLVLVGLLGTAVVARPLSAGGSEVGEQPASSGFSDVPAGHPFADAITWMVSEEITTGFPDGTFRPSAPITRQAMAAFLHRFGQSTMTADGAPFVDVPASSPFADAIEWMVFREITTGFPGNTFRPSAPITRQAMAAFLNRFWAPTVVGEPPAFSDVPGSHPFAAEIGWLSSSGVTTGFPDGTFRPGAPITRQAMAAFLWRLAGEPEVGDPGINRVDTDEVTILAVDDVASVTAPSTDVDAGDLPTTVTLKPGASAPAVGAIVVVEVSPAAPHGAAGRVVSVTGQQVVLEAVAMNEVVPVASFEASSTAASEVALSDDAVAQAESALGGCGLGADVQLAAPLISLTPEVRADWDTGGINELTAVFRGEIGIGASMQVGGGITCEVPLSGVLPELAFAPIPLPFLPPAQPVFGSGGSFELLAGVSVGVDGSLTLGFEVGFEYVGGSFQPVLDGGTDAGFDLTPVDEWLSGTAELFVGARMGLRWANSVGVYVESGPFVNVQVTPLDATAISVNAGGRFSGYLEADVFFFDAVRVDLAEVSFAGTHVLGIGRVEVDDEPLDPAPVGAEYVEQIRASGGEPFEDREPRGEYDFEVVSGTLPPGIEMDEDGALTGTLAEEDAGDGPWSITVQARDSIGLTGEHTFEIESADLTITPTSIPDIVPGQAYSQQLTATGGVEPYSFSVSEGALPDGLTLSASGLLSGNITTEEAGDAPWSFTVTATDAEEATGQVQLTLDAVPTVITVSPATAPDAVADQPYSLQLGASGGVEPYTWAISAGSLPPGLSISPTTGLISGTVVAADADDGPWTFTATATDDDGVIGFRQYTIDATTPASPAAQLAVGIGHLCAIEDDGSVSCWGVQEANELEPDVPMAPPSGQFSSLSTGHAFTVDGEGDYSSQACGVRVDGTIHCWGAAVAGFPTPPTGTFTSVSHSSTNVCGVRADGTLACSGSGPVASPPGGTYTDLTISGGSGCALPTGGGVVCWGSTTWVTDPPPTSGSVSELAGVGVPYCVLDDAGLPVCWTDVFINADEPMPTTGSFVQLAASNNAACALSPAGQTDCWGDSAGFSSSYFPPPDTTFDSIAMGPFKACGIEPDGSIECWGADVFIPTHPT